MRQECISRSIFVLSLEKIPILWKWSHKRQPVNRLSINTKHWAAEIAQAVKLGLIPTWRPVQGSGSTAQGAHWPVGSTEEAMKRMRGLLHLTYEDRQKTRFVQPREENAPGKAYSTFQYLKGLQERWRGTSYKALYIEQDRMALNWKRSVLD